MGNYMAQAVDAQSSNVGERVTVMGTLKEVSMTNFPNNPWTELAVQAKDGSLYILIGKESGKLFKQVGKQGTVIGTIKPWMKVRGTPTPVIEVKNVEMKPE